MSKPHRLRLAALIVPMSLAGTMAGAAAPEKQTVQVANASPRIVVCGVVVDSKLRTLLKIRPGKAWADAYDVRQTLQLVCERAAKGAVWRVKPGSSYRLVDAGGKVDIAEAAAE